MPPPPAARAKVLHAYAEVLVASGERSATLEAVAEQAGVSKGGLLYHFPSKESLAEGLVEHLRGLTASDVVAMRSAPEGAVDYLLRTSTVVDGEFELVYLAVSRLSQGLFPQAAAVIQEAQEAWTDAVRDEVGDPVLARAVALMSEGLYALATAGAPSLDTTELDDLLALVHDVAVSRSSSPSASTSSTTSSPTTSTT